MKRIVKNLHLNKIVEFKKDMFVTLLLYLVVELVVIVTVTVIVIVLVSKNGCIEKFFL